MKQVFSKFSFFVALFFAVLSLTSCGSDESIAKDPSKIADAAGWNIPEYSILNRDDNMERDASAWSEYDYILQLSDLSVDGLKALDDLCTKDSHWTFDETKNEYHYKLNEDDKAISITVNKETRKVTMAYAWYDMLA